MKNTGLLSTVVAAVMGCFFGCLCRNRSKPTSTSTSSPAASEVVNQLSPLLVTESMKEEEVSKSGDEGNGELQADADMNELEDEEKFLKAWGTLSDTPTEIRKISREGKCKSRGNYDPEDLKFRPWCVLMPTEQLNIEKEPTLPLTPPHTCEELAKGTVSLSLQNSRTLYIRPDEGSIGDQSAMPFKVHADQGHQSASVAQGIKSVRFKENLSPELACETSKDLRAASICNISKPDPHPTPLRLNDEMQTPGTVFSAYPDGMANGKKNRIRSQYVKAVLNPVENSYQWQGMKAEISELRKLSVDLDESLEEAEHQ